MSSEEEGGAAIRQFDGHEVGGRALKVNEAKPREDRGSNGKRPIELRVSIQVIRRRLQQILHGEDAAQVAVLKRGRQLDHAQIAALVKDAKR